MRLARETAIFLLFVGLTVFMTWPLAIRMSTSVSDLGDPMLNAWIVDWTSYALLHQPLRLFEAPVFHPGLYPLAYSEHLIGIALLTLPFDLMGLTPLTVYNIAMILAFALSGYGAFVLARMLTPSFPAALAGGIFFAFVSQKFDHLAHLQVVFSGWVPLVLAALVYFWRKPTWRSGMLLTGAFVMNGLTNVYYLLFAGAAIGVTMLFLATAAPKRDRRFWLRLFASLGLAGILLFPTLLPYKIVSDKYGMKRSEAEVQGGSATWRGWLSASNRSLLYGAMGPEDWRRHEQVFFPGFVALLLLGVAIAVRSVPRVPRSSSGSSAGEPVPRVPRSSSEPQPRNPQELRGTEEPEELRGTHVPPPTTDNRQPTTLKKALTVILILSGILSILSLLMDRVTLRMFGRLVFAMRGSDIPLMIFIVAAMLRLPLRAWIARSRFTVEQWMAAVWMVVGFLGSFGLNSFFFAFLFKRLFVFESLRAPGRFVVIAYTGLAVFIAIGAASLIRKRKVFAPLVVALVLIDTLPDVRWEQALVEMPPLYPWIQKERIERTLELPIHGWWEAQYLQGNSLHRLMSLNGTSGWEAPDHYEMRMDYEANKFDEVFTRAERNGATLMVIHAHWLDASKARDGIRPWLASGRLQYLRKFDHGLEGDFVFAFPRNLPDWQRLRAPDVPDGAGHLPAETLVRFLAGEPTHSSRPFGMIESPAWDSENKGVLQVRGWAIVPSFVREIRVLIDHGRRVYVAERVPRPEITKRYWWYYEQLPGFSVDIPKKPFGVPRVTDIQIEIVDQTGRRTRLPDVFFYWE